ncbi:MAG: DUF5050 domain-containing protein [Tannerella sp.]|jgi:hypothetical protein|nr:DUF5050 domain-containing protein [Tannerella sp.]
MKKNLKLRKELKGVKKLSQEEMRTINGGGRYIYYINEKGELCVLYVED